MIFSVDYKCNFYILLIICFSRKIGSVRIIKLNVVLICFIYGLFFGSKWLLKMVISISGRFMFNV